jgi:EmrB/QacA subfamily drug resistance transporter
MAIRPPSGNGNDPGRHASTGGRLSLREPAPLPSLERLSYYPWLVVAMACVAAFIGQLDASIVQLALPELEHVFDAPLHAVSWVAVGYVLGFAAILPVFSRLAEMAGRKLMYLAGFTLFGLVSALCGLAPDLPSLIGLRVLQGMSGAMLGANSVVIVVAAVGAANKGRALGFIAAAQAVGVSAGPALGGMLLGALGWRWIFWVSVPFALAAAIVGWLVVPRTVSVNADQRFDAPGAIMLVPALTTVFLALTHLHAWGLWSAPTLACIAAALVLLFAFTRREERVPAPLLDVLLFRLPPFTGGCVAVVLSYAMLYAMFFVVSFALVRGYHDTPLAAGLRLSIIPIALALVAPVSGGLADRYPRLTPVAGMATCIAGALALGRIMTGTAQSMPATMVALAVFGTGLGLFIAPNNSATLGAAPPQRTGQAGGLLNLLRAFGTGLGVAAASTVLSWRLAESSAALGRTVGLPEAALLAAVGDVLTMVAAFALIAGAASLVRARPAGVRSGVP